MINPPFIKGLQLSELFFDESIRPILELHLPDLIYSAALLGRGSEVMGFDTPQSMDHDWGPRLMLFLSEVDQPVYAKKIDRVLQQELPREIHGYPTNLAIIRSSDRPIETDAEVDLTDHSVVILTVCGFFKSVLNFDPNEAISPGDWLSVPEDHLRSLTGGRVFHDGLCQLESIRARLHYYPRDVWLYLLAAQWKRIAQEEAFMGRCGQVCDDLGSRLIAARLVRDLMRLCFLMERQYAPYIKWFGTAFAQLTCAGNLIPIFSHVLEANTWQEREDHLTMAYGIVAKMHNELGITGPLSTQVSQFYTRPFRVIHADRFVDAIRAVITSEEIRRLPENLGSVNQFVDSTDAINILNCLGGYSIHDSISAIRVYVLPYNPLTLRLRDELQ